MTDPTTPASTPSDPAPNCKCRLRAGDTPSCPQHGHLNHRSSPQSTPLPDAEATPLTDRAMQEDDRDEEYWTSFARNLERRLATAKADAQDLCRKKDRLAVLLSEESSALATLQRENAALREEKEGILKAGMAAHEIALEQCDALRTSLATKDAQIAELRELLSKAVERESVWMLVMEDNKALTARAEAAETLPEELKCQRDAALALVETCRKALERAADVFMDYARLHAAKGTQDGHIKAQANILRSNECSQALAALLVAGVEKGEILSQKPSSRFSLHPPISR